MNDLEARKKLLVAESEVYRQTLRLDVQNLRLYSIQMQRKYATYAALKPALMVAIPFVSSVFSRREQETERRPTSLVSKVLAGWKMYRSFQPLIASLMAQYAAGQGLSQATGDEKEEDSPAAAI